MKSIPSNAGFACFKNLLAVALTALMGGALLSNPIAARAGTLTIPDNSFETPDASQSIVLTNFNYWEKNPQPSYYGDTGYPWDDTMGIFYNAPGSGYIDNCDGVQNGYIFELPGAGIYQDYNSQDESQSVPSHAFNHSYNPTNAYTLTVAVLGYPDTGSGSPLSSNATITLSLYYRDVSNNAVTIAATTVTNTVANFPVHTHFIDFQVQVPAVRTNDAWAGKNIGIALNSSVTDFDSGETGGYWDVDNVRLVETPTPSLQGAALTNGQAGFTLWSQPGLKYKIQTAASITTTGSNWVSLATVTNTTGFLQFTDTNAVAGVKFYRAQQQP